MTFHYMGKYSGDPESLPHGEHEPNAVKFREPEDTKKLGMIANGIAVALLIVTGVIYMLRGRAAWSGWALPLYLLSLVPHEFLHGLCFLQRGLAAFQILLCQGDRVVLSGRRDGCRGADGLRILGRLRIGVGLGLRRGRCGFLLTADEVGFVLFQCGAFGGERGSHAFEAFSFGGDLLRGREFVRGLRCCRSRCGGLCWLRRGLRR